MTTEPPSPRRAAAASRMLVTLLAGIFVLGLVGFVAAVLSAADEPVASADPSPADPSPAASVAGAAARVIGPGPQEEAAAADPPAASSASPAIPAPPAIPDSPDPSPSTPADAASPSAEPGASAGVASAPATEPTDVGTLAERAMPVVPVVGFWSAQAAIDRQDVIKALRSGSLQGARRILVEEGLRGPLEAELGIDIAPQVREVDAATIEAAVARGALGFLRATHVGPSVRALAIGGRSLFGNDRIRSPSGWPLTVSLDLPRDEAWQQGQTWVLVAAGDSFTDRGVYDRVVKRGKGIDYPFGGGTARVTGHSCCDPVFHDNVVPRYVLTGDKGIVRRFFQAADLAIVNHEQPVTTAAVHHTSGTRFSGMPKLARMFKRAGIDWVSLANNHIKDYGSDGIADSRRILAQQGIGFGGAGKDLKQARRISYLPVAGRTVAIIPCVGVTRASWAGPKVSGGTPCLDRYLVPDIREARRQADLVIVFPHWGVEYTRQPLPSMRKHAAKWVRAGADLIVGAHSHVAGAIEDVDGRPVIYSMGNLIFDQNWSTNTMESALVEATFEGDRLAQLRLHPYLIHDQAQPNFLDPVRGEGRRLLKEIKRASKEWLDW